MFDSIGTWLPSIEFVAVEKELIAPAVISMETLRCEKAENDTKKRTVISSGFFITY